jgi:hypothetical protein
MPYVPVTTVGDQGDGQPVIVLSLELNAARTVIGWQVINGSTKDVDILLTTGNFAITQTFAPGTHSGSIPRNRQWNYDEGSDTSFGITVEWTA